MIYLTDYRMAYTDATQLFENIVYPQKVHWFPELYARTKTGLAYPPHKLAEKLLDEAFLTKFRQKSCKTAFILAAGNTNFAGINPRKHEDNELTYNYKILPLTLTQIFAGRIAQLMGITDQVTTDSSACASSLKVMMDVHNLINYYGFERVVVLTVEDPVSNSVLEFFGEAKASLSYEEEKTGIVPSAFDSKNYGFHVGQGAAIAVFESSTTDAKARLVSAYTASENSTNAIGQREDGEGFEKAIIGAMHMAKLNHNQIAVVKTHGTGTKSNNVAERSAICKRLTNFVATSFKPKIGHTMGASGLLETLILLDNMQQGIIPGILNRTEKDGVFLSEDIKARNGYILSLAAGMGNVYSAAIFESM